MCWLLEKVSEQRRLTAPCTARPDRDSEIYHFLEQKKNIWLYLNVNPGHNAALLSCRTELSRMKVAENCSDEQFARP